MGWIAIVFICVLVILIVIFNVSRRKRSENDIRKPIEDNKSKTVMDTLSKPSNLTISRDARNKYKDDEQQRDSKQVGPYGYSGGGTRTHARYDWQKRFEESIITPFPEEWSLASPHLHEAYRLEEEGADQEKIQKVLEKARQADKDATAFYLGRMSIIKKVRSERQRDR